jgi:hypothetical protein
MQNLGSVEDSKAIQEIKMDNNLIKNQEKTSLFISSSFNGKIKGYIAASNNRDIVIYNLEGSVINNFFSLKFFLKFF